MRLGEPPRAVDEEPPPSSSPLRSVGIAGMSACALIGIVSLLLLVTVTWPAEAARYIRAASIGSVIGFLACASLAMSSAMGSTRRHEGAPDGEREQH